MQGNWRIGSLFGIPLCIDYSWFLIIILVTVINASEISATGLSQGQPLLGWLTSLGMALLLFASVLLHELGHSLVALSQGITVNSITLFIFGGVAAIAGDSKTPRQALQVALAGPGVSLLLAGTFFGLTQVIPGDSLLHLLVSNLGKINLVLALFNLIPGLPLDGGQVFKAMIWRFTGSRLRGVKWAATAGKIIAWLGIILGLSTVFLTRQFGAVWLVFIGWFILRNASAYAHLTNLQETLLALKAKDAMTREFRVVDANLTVREFTEQHIIPNMQTPRSYYAASEGRYRGLVRFQDLQLVEREEWTSKTLAEIVPPLREIPTVEEGTSLVEVIKKLEREELGRLTVVSPAGGIAGIIDRGDIVRVLAEKENLAIPEEEIKSIKTAGTYSPALRLDAIVEALEE